jgi:GNAT superfamily N-acetyltransferase
MARRVDQEVPMTTAWRVLTLGDRDPVAPVEEVVRLIDLAGTSTGAAYSRSDVVEALHGHQPAVVALSSAGDLVGVVVARVAGPDAHVLAFALHPQWRRRGIGSALLRQLDQEVIHRGSSRLLAVVQAGQVGEDAFVNQGFTHLEGLHLYARDASMVPEELAVVERFGGTAPQEGLWESM